MESYKTFTAKHYCSCAIYLVSCGVVCLQVLAKDRPAAVRTGSSSPIKWGPMITIADPPIFKDAGMDGRLDDRPVTPGTFGTDFPRAIHLADGRWLCVYTAYENGDTGYRTNPRGGTRLYVSVSKDDGKSWTSLSSVADPDRDLDNGQFMELPDGSILLSTRSVRWQESYRLPVYRSRDGGKSWKCLSLIDANEGKPGSLGKPDKGVYEPFLFRLDPSRIGVLYSSERYVTSSPSYSQIVSEKVSMDGGSTWGPEIRVTAERPQDRPGMPVLAKTKQDKYLVVYELCGPEDCEVHSKTSSNGVDWPVGLGVKVPVQRGAPFVAAMKDGTLVVTSNNHSVSISRDSGSSWTLVDPAFPGSADVAFFSSIYPLNDHSVLVLTGLNRPGGGRRIVGRIGTVVAPR